MKLFHKKEKKISKKNKQPTAEPENGNQMFDKFL